MDIGRPLKLVDISGPGEMEITTEGISMLQSFNNDIGIVGIIGTSDCGKSTLANKLIGSNQGFDISRTSTTTKQGI